MKKIILTYIVLACITLIALLLINFFNISYPLSIKTYTQSQNELSVVGEGKVDVTPDIAFIDVGVSVNNAYSVQQARDQMIKVNNTIIEQLGLLGINKKDITTNNFSIYQGYDNNGIIDGYNGNATLTIKVRKISLVSPIIEKATDAGANNIGGIRFMVDKPEKYREQARERAIQNAREQGEKIAKNLGIKLGKIVNIVESTPNNYFSLYEKNTWSGMGGGGVNIEPGMQTVTSVVTLYFEKR